MQRPMKGDHTMDEVVLKYGDSVMKLKKSDTLIAVKPHPGTEARALTHLAPQLAEPARQQTTLGGFRLLNIKELRGADVERTLDTLRANPAVAVGTHVYQTSDDGVPFVPTGQLYLEFTADASPEAIQELLDTHKLEILEARGEHALIAQVTLESENPIKTAAALQQSPLVLVAEPDLATPGMVKSFALPLDELLQDQWHLRNTGRHRGTTFGFRPGADARVVAAWEAARTMGDPRVIVALIDDGFDLKHPDLAGDGKIVAPRDFTRNSDAPLPDLLGADWHGTACAGVAVGNADSRGIVGAAPYCRLMPVRWGRELSDREIEDWFGWVMEQGAWVVSCSWGAVADVFRLSTRMSRAIARCAREGRNGLGCVICFAAGNDNRDINDPLGSSVDGFAIHPDVIAVAACTSRDQRSNYSNFGKELAICAPSSGAGGWGITTTDVMGRFMRQGVWVEAGYSPGAYTNDFGGTSSACPLVAGICALLLSIRPQLTAAEVRTLIQRTARRVGDPASYDANGHSIYHGYGCIDALAAVQALTAASAPPESAPVVRIESTPLLPIPDNQPDGITSVAAIPQTGRVARLAVSVDIQHPYIGDLQVSLISPTGRSAMMHNRSGKNASDLITTYTSADSSALAALAGEEAQGDWTLKVADLAGQDIGTLRRWSLEIGLQEAGDPLHGRAVASTPATRSAPGEPAAQAPAELARRPDARSGLAEEMVPEVLPAAAVRNDPSPDLRLEVGELDVVESQAGQQVGARVPAQRMHAQIPFRLSGAAAATLAAHQSPYTIQVAASNLATGQTRVLAADHQQLDPELLDYMATLWFDLPEVGRYRLLGTILIPEGDIAATVPGPVLTVVPEE